MKQFHKQKGVCQKEEGDKTESLKKELAEVLNSDTMDDMAVEKITRLLEEIEEREGAIEVDCNKSWMEFQQKYLPLAEQERIARKQSHGKKKYKKLFRISAAVAAALLCTQFAFVAIGGKGFLHFDVESTDETFTITGGNHLENQLKETLRELKREKGISIPTLGYLPQGYELEDLSELSSEVYLLFTNENEEYIKFSILIEAPENGSMVIEKDPGIEKFYHSGIEYQLMTNYDSNIVFWTKAGIGYLIISTLDMKECKKIATGLKY